MKDLGVVRKVPIQWGGMHPVFEAVLLLKHTQWTSSAMEVLHHHSIYDKDDYDTSKEIQEILVKQQDMFMGIRFAGSAHDGL